MMKSVGMVMLQVALFYIVLGGNAKSQMVLDGSGNAALIQKDPASIGHIDYGGYARDIYVSGSYAYLATYDDGLRIYDITMPTYPLPVGHIDEGGEAYGIHVSGSYAYLANYDDVLRIYDITDPSEPDPVGHADDGGSAEGIYVSGSYAYLASQYHGLRIYDVTDPANPLSVSRIDDGGVTVGIYVSGSYAYLANYEDGLRIYDITDPSAPEFVDYVDDGGYAEGIYVSGSFAYLANGTDGLRIYYIADPTNPLNVGHIDDSGSAYGIYVSGSYAYLANYSDGLRIYDVSGVDAPTGFIGALASTNVDVTQNLIVGNDACVESSLAVGAGGLQVDPGNGIKAANLHVRRSVGGNAGDPENNIAVFENTNAATNEGPDVLSLIMHAENPGAGSNFISFSDGIGMLGSIEGTGGSIQLNTSGGDFAEYLPKENVAEELKPGDIVGLFAGKVTRKTEDAERLMVITTSPAVLGNRPREENDSAYAKVAFVGQVPVNVAGPVGAGDYIIASGRTDGTGLAVSAEDIRLDQIPHTVGRALEGSHEEDVKPVRVLVGVSSDPMFFKMLQKKEARISELESRLAALESMIKEQRFAAK